MLLFGLLTTLSPEARAQSPLLAPRHRVIRSAPTAQPTFGVMGAVGRPGAYTSDTPTPLLVEIVGMAGGLTESATGNVRIVRGGRRGQQAFYSPGLEFRLQPGDLVVADSRPEGGSKHQAYGQVTTASGTNAGGVQLAFLDVLDRPVVLRMRRDDASIHRILTLLNQPLTLASSVRVVETGPAYTRGTRDENTQLANGSVLVFDGKAVDRTSLPPLPPVVNTDGTAPADATPVPRRPAELTPERPEPRPFVAPPSTDSVSRSDDGVPASSASLTRRSQYPLPPLGLMPTPVPVPSQATKPAESTDVEARPPLPSPLGPSTNSITEAVAEPVESRPIQEEAPSEPDVPAPSFLDAGPDTSTNELAEAERSETATDAPTATPPATDSGSLAIVLIVLFIAAGLIWLLSRRSEQVGSIQLGDTTPEDDVPSASPVRRRIDTAEPATVSLHSRPQPSSSLDDLIADRVPFQEEPVSLPSGLEMFGRPNSTVRHRVDEPEEPTATRGPRRPHSVRQLAAAVAAEEAAAEATPSAPKRTDDASNAIDRRSARLLDRALTAVHGARR